MCYPFSCVVDRNATVYWYPAEESHTQICMRANAEHGVSLASENWVFPNAAFVEVTPYATNYLYPDLPRQWVAQTDKEVRTPAWWHDIMMEGVWSAFYKWRKAVYDDQIDYKALRTWKLGRCAGAPGKDIWSLVRKDRSEDNTQKIRERLGGQLYHGISNSLEAACLGEHTLPLGYGLCNGWATPLVEQAMGLDANLETIELFNAGYLPAKQRGVTVLYSPELERVFCPPQKTQPISVTFMTGNNATMTIDGLRMTKTETIWATEQTIRSTISQF